MRRSFLSRLGPLFVLLLLAFQQPAARAGSCIGGERAKLRYLFEHLGKLVSVEIQKAGLQADSLVHGLANYLPHFSLWWLRVETRKGIQDLFKSAAQDAEKPLDVKQLRDLVTSFWDRAGRIHEQLLGPKPDTQELLDETVLNLEKSWAICRSIKAAGRGPCQQLAALNQSAEQNCTSLMLRFGVLYPGRCSLGKHGELMARLLGQTPEKARTICEILKNRQSEQCRPALSSPLMAQICLAMTGQGEVACKHASLPEDDQKECLRNLYDYEVANGSRSLASWEQLTSPDPMLLAAAMSAREPCDCDCVIMQLFDRLDKSAEDLFMQSNRWYQPPGIP